VELCKWYANTKRLRTAGIEYYRCIYIILTFIGLYEPPSQEKSFSINNNRRCTQYKIFLWSMLGTYIYFGGHSINLILYLSRVRTPVICTSYSPVYNYYYNFYMPTRTNPIKYFCFPNFIIYNVWVNK